MASCSCTGPTTGDHLCPCRRKAEDARQAAQRAEDGVFSPWNACCYREGCQKRATDYAALEAKLREALRDAERYQWIRENCFPHEYFSRPQPHVVLSVYLGHDEKGRLKVMHPGPESHVGIPSLDCAIDAAIAAQAESGGGKDG